MEVSFNEVCQFINDGCTLKNKHKCQAFGMQLTDRAHRHNNAVSLLFRKVLSREADKVSESSQDLCTEVLDKNFVDIFASSVQCLSTSKVSVECDMN